jgi:hypothetical protein
MFTNTNRSVKVLNIENALTDKSHRREADLLPFSEIGSKQEASTEFVVKGSVIG